MTYIRQALLVAEYNLYHEFDIVTSLYKAPLTGYNMKNVRLTEDAITTVFYNASDAKLKRISTLIEKVNRKRIFVSTVKSSMVSQLSKPFYNFA